MLTLSKKSFLFFNEIHKNNTVTRGKSWYQENKPTYEELIRHPLASICEEVGNKIRKFEPEVYVEPKANLSRLHRDLRFTTDHRPFKEWASFWLWLGNRSQKKLRPGFYFHIEKNQVFIGAGRWWFHKPELKRYRELLLNDYKAKELKDLLTKLEKKFNGPEKHFKTINKLYREKSIFPEGFLYHGMNVWEEHKLDKKFYSEDIVPFLVKQFKAMHPMVRWCDENICNPKLAEDEF